MKKNLKKLGAVIIAMAMCLSLCCTALAANSGDTQGSITINGVAGETYDIYQIFELTYDSAEDDEGDTLTSYSYQVVEAWRSFLTTYPSADTPYFIIDEAGYLDPSSGIFQIETDSDFMAAFAQAALVYATATENEIEATATANAGTDGTVVFEGLNLGWYLVDSSLGSLCMLTSTDPDAVINEKNSEPTISKYVSDPTFGESTDDDLSSDDADNENTLEYKLVINDVGNVSNLLIHDYLDEDQLDVTTLEIKSVILYADAEAATGTTLEEGVGYTLTVGECSKSDCPMAGCSFEISIPDNVLSGLSNDAYIVVIYDVLLDEEWEDFDENLIDEIDNYAVLSYGTSSYSEVVEAETYSFGFEIFKYTDYTEFTGVSDYVITVSAYNDSPNGQQDEMFLALVDYEDGVGEITYYAVFTADEDNENTYIISQWVPASDVQIIEDGPNIYATYTDANGVTQDLPYITEPAEDAGTVEFTFNYHGVMPSHDMIVLDEMGTAYSEDDEASEQAREGDIVIALSGAEFVLSKTNDEGNTVYGIFEFEAQVEDNEGNVTIHDGWLLMDWTEDINDATHLTSETDGMIYVEGLHDGDYTLTEVKAPDGYNLLSGGILITITDNGTVIVNNETLADKVVEVLNNAGAELPGTGGIGTTIFYIIGGLLVVGAVVVLVTRRRMTNES